MKQNELIFTDAHFTSKPEDAYRFEIFDNIISLIKDNNIKRVIYLGDLTERKDRHKSVLVNKLVENFKKLASCKELESIIFVCGNHDYYSVDNPFFKFLENIEKVLFIQTTTKIGTDLFVPHAEKLEVDKYKDSVKRVFMHHLIEGAVWNTTDYLKSKHDFILLKDLESFDAVYSGHIHTGQEIQNVTYIGSPYHIDFGDKFRGRVLLLPKKNSVWFGFPQKISLKISSIEELQLASFKQGDFFKIEYSLDQNDLKYWDDINNSIIEFCDVNKVNLVEISPTLKESSITETVLCGNTTEEQIVDYCFLKKLDNDHLIEALSIIKNTII